MVTDRVPDGIAACECARDAGGARRCLQRYRQVRRTDDTPYQVRVRASRCDHSHEARRVERQFNAVLDLQRVDDGNALRIGELERNRERGAIRKTSAADRGAHVRPSVRRLPGLVRERDVRLQIADDENGRSGNRATRNVP